jgi:hypothetical protein
MYSLQRSKTSGKLISRAGQLLSSTSGNPCCYKHSYKCSDNSPQNLWMRTSLIPASNTIIEGGICYYFIPTDTPTPCYGPLHATPPVSVTGCADAACGAGCPSSCTGCTFATATLALPGGDPCNNINGGYSVSGAAACDWSTGGTVPAKTGNGTVYIHIYCNAGTWYFSVVASNVGNTTYAGDWTASHAGGTCPPTSIVLSHSTIAPYNCPNDLKLTLS